MKKIVYLAAALWLTALPQISSAEETLQSLQGEIKALEEKVGELETHASDGSRSRSIADLNGYIDFSVQGDNRTNDNSTFQFRTLSLFIGKEIGAWRMFSELEFVDGTSHVCDPAAGCSGTGEINLETAWIEYNMNDSFHFRGGILLVPTHWRVNHYPSITLSSSDPLMNEVIFPPSIAGLMIYGKKYIGGLGVDYRVYAGNGEGDGTNNPNAADNNDQKAIGTKVVLDVPTGDLFERFQVGGHFYTDISMPSQRKTVWGGEWILERHPFNLLAEYARAFYERDITGTVPAYDAYGYYIQPSVHLNTNWILFYRYDLLNNNSGLLDMAASQADETRNILGLNFRPIPEISIKFEYFTASPRNTIAYPDYDGWVTSLVLFL